MSLANTIKNLQPEESVSFRRTDTGIKILVKVNDFTGCDELKIDKPNLGRSYEAITESCESLLKKLRIRSKLG